MDGVVKERDIVIDIERCIVTSKEIGGLNSSNDKDGKLVSIRVCSLPMSVDESILSSNLKNVGEVTPDSAKNAKKEKCKSASAKRAPKPPRPPRGFSLDAADQKLVKEIAELAMIKRARIERMKALKKMKASKASSVSASSSGNLIAMLFTLLFCFVIIFQGCHSLGISSRNSSVSGVPSSLQSGGATDGNLVLLQDKWNLSTSSAPLTVPLAPNPNPIDGIPSSDSQQHDDQKAVE